MHKNHKNTFFSNTHKNVVCDFFFSTHHIKLSMTAQEHKCTTKGVKSFLVCSHRASLSSLQCLFTDTETKFYQSVPRKTKWEFNKKQETAQQQKKRNLLGTAGPLGYFLHCWSVLNGATSSIWTSSSSHLITSWLCLPSSPSQESISLFWMNSALCCQGHREICRFPSTAKHRLCSLMV